jgi:hypothetical protein
VGGACHARHGSIARARKPRAREPPAGASGTRPVPLARPFR